MFDRLVRAVLPLAHRALLAWSHLTGLRAPSATVAVWHGGRVLLVRHSYRRGWGLPGGHLRHGEAPAAGAARELYEELGIAAAHEELVPVATPGPWHWFEYHPEREPAFRPDGIEVVEARFVEAREARRHASMHRYFRIRFGPPGSEAGGAPVGVGPVGVGPRE